MVEVQKKQNVNPKDNVFKIVNFKPKNEQAGELWFDPQMSLLVDRVIRETPEFHWIASRKLLTLGKESLGKRGAKIKRASDYEMILSDVEIIMTISDEVWQKLSEQGKMALITHELCHLVENEKGEIETIDHEVEEFSFVISRYGSWNVSIANMAKQLELFNSLHETKITSIKSKIDQENEEIESEDKS